jgi:isopentenyl diphosphate isomerase/L-lactate dehydrogenase-like FMN-dependent dehydrogenase
MIRRELRTTMFLLGAENVTQLPNAEVKFSNRLKTWE